MKIVNQSFKIMDDITGHNILRKIEECGRVCYKSEEHMTEESSERFVKTLIDSKHESVLEHVSITVKCITNRAIANELVRHRIASYSQESSRYCNYSKDKFNNEITVIRPTEYEIDSLGFSLWLTGMRGCEEIYFNLLELGYTPDVARGVLPLDLKTEIIISMNLRSYRNLFLQRTPDVAHYQIRELVKPILKEFKKLVPVIFDDIKTKGEIDNE